MLKPLMTMRETSRREILVGSVAFVSALTLGTLPAGASPETLQEAIKAFAGEAEIVPGKMLLDLPPLVENGNSVPVTVTVESAMTPSDFVRTIAVFNEKNPQPNVSTFHLGPRAGRASVSTRIRLATSQKLTAIAEMGDGTFRSHSVDVTVMLAACVEG